MGPVVSFTTVAAQLPAVSGKSWLELPGVSAIGFWFEHKGGAPRQTMSVADIEDKTGHTFFPNVPNAPKDIYNASEW